MSRKLDKSIQLDRFKKAAREAGADESEEVFDKALKKIAQAPPPKSDKPKKGKPGH